MTKFLIDHYISVQVIDELNTNDIKKWIDFELLIYVFPIDKTKVQVGSKIKNHLLIMIDLIYETY